MTSSRKPPHCKTCHKPLKGHKRGVCHPSDVPSPSAASVLPSRSMSTKNQKPTPSPLDRVPTVSAESSQVLNDILRANSHSTPAQMLEAKRNGSRRSGRQPNYNKMLREALDCVNVDEEERKPGDKTSTRSKHEESEALSGAGNKECVLQVQSHTGSLPPSSPCVVSQHRVVKASRTGSALDPLMITMSQQLKLEESMPGGPCNSQQQHLTFNAPSADLTIQNFLNSMAGNAQHPPATMFSYPIDCMKSLEDGVRGHGLCMHIMSLPSSKQGWVPVVVGRDTNAITQLLEDGEKLARGLRRPDKFKVHDFDLGMSHIVVGAIGALATWAGLAYS